MGRSDKINLNLQDNVNVNHITYDLDTNSYVYSSVSTTRGTFIGLEMEQYISQWKENCNIDSRKLILDDDKIVMLGSFDNDLFKRKIQNKFTNK